MVHPIARDRAEQGAMISFKEMTATTPSEQAAERSKLSSSQATIAVDAEPVVHAVAVRAAASGDNTSGQDGKNRHQGITVAPKSATVSTGFQ